MYGKMGRASSSKTLDNLSKSIKHRRKSDINQERRPRRREERIGILLIVMIIETEVIHFMV